MATDHYATLGIQRSAAPEEIKRAYRDLVKRLHPDRDPSPRAAERFMGVHQAYETLRDPLLRIAYDARFLQPKHRDTRYRTAEPKPAPSDPLVPDIKVRSWAFLGLHVTGLFFAISIITSLLLGVFYRHWPWGGLFFMIPGLVVLPDAWRGISMWRTGRVDRIRMR
jgi:DnaJ domain